MTWREKSLRVFWPDPKSEEERPMPWVTYSLLPLAQVKAQLWSLPYSPFHFLWDSRLSPAQSLISFHRLCAAFCSASWGSIQTKFFLPAANYGKTGIQEVRPREKVLWALVHRATSPQNSSPDRHSRWGSGLRQHKEHHKHIHGPIKMHILRKGMLKIC